MKIICVMVSSVDGKTTAGTTAGVNAWNSSEDQEFFKAVIQQSPVVIMGRRTFAAARNLIKPSSKPLRIVITRQPQNWTHELIPGQLEFSAETPSALVRRLELAGYEQAILVGGSQLNASFLEAGLISELWLTREPVILGEGLPLIDDQLQQRLTLLSVERFNSRGTLLTKYALLPPSPSPEP